MESMAPLMNWKEEPKLNYYKQKLVDLNKIIQDSATLTENSQSDLEALSKEADLKETLVELRHETPENAKTTRDDAEKVEKTMFWRRKGRSSFNSLSATASNIPQAYENQIVEAPL